MKTIYKYHLAPVSVQEKQMPFGAQIMYINKQGDDICLWALVDTAQHLVERKIQCIGTGRPLPDEYKGYVGTVLDGAFVWHFLEI